MSSKYTTQDLVLLEKLLEKKLFTLAAARQKVMKSPEELEELELTTQILKFVQHIAQREVRELRFEELHPHTTFHKSSTDPALTSGVDMTFVGVPQPLKIVQEQPQETICTNCKQKNPYATHCVHRI